ncbi:hypothetical protein MWN34_16625 [Ancylobacter sp. 6x-1]|uniref:Uncharacterized protein n=1 Tax=Ancylobacter crimeensis TaxID=2579147 RepID=A0ABT0DF07_9HYPH|nr:hypothetical protein [Ancylobacter crimeensis]MCK0198531.1 hypothetical protein [Ancylobacter crimeensis]
MNNEVLSASDLLAIEDTIAALETEIATLPVQPESETEVQVQSETRNAAKKPRRKTTEAKTAVPVESDESETTTEALPTLPVHVPGDLKEMMGNANPSLIAAKITDTAYALETRAAFEKAKNPANEKMQANLASYRKRMTSEIAARVMIATDVDPEFVNREISTGSRFNVYPLSIWMLRIGLTPAGCGIATRRAEV